APLSAAMFLATGLEILGSMVPAGVPAFSAHPGIDGVTAVAAAAMICALTAVFLCGRVTSLELWISNTLLLGLLGCILAIYLPGACYVLLLPTAAGLMAIPAIRRRPNRYWTVAV